MPANYRRLALPSLARRFDAPDGFKGHFGWVCGYSADASFLDDAAERFTGMTAAQRAHRGRIFLALALDPGAPPLSILDMPGVAHLPVRIRPEERPFRLMHAKVAMLGFRNTEAEGRWLMRLIVSTGNWTRQTLEESLDMAWTIDIKAEMLNEIAADVQQACADIKAANELFAFLREIYDTRLLNAGSLDGYSETADACAKVNCWIAKCSGSAGNTSRFIDNLDSSLLETLPSRVHSIAGSASRNYLAMGSGFFESASTGSQPVVPGKIVDRIRAEKLLTAAACIDLYVNRDACQSIATAVKLLKENEGIIVRPACTPEKVFGKDNDRALHGKFLFSANYRKNFNTCSKPWVYLGSGNLTSPGFVSKMGRDGGNLEAGVVFAPDELYWYEDKRIEDERVVTHLLPIQWDDDFAGDAEQPLPGEEKTPPDGFYFASPVAWLCWHESEDGNELRVGERFAGDLQVLDSQSNPCERTATGFSWREPQPRLVVVRWYTNDGEHLAQVPVVDPHGRIASVALTPLNITEAWWQLAEFPESVEDDVEDEGDHAGLPSLGGPEVRHPGAIATNYPIREMMELLEGVASKQTALNVGDWGLWCNRLEQTLSRAKNSDTVNTFRELCMNPLAPLRAAPFRPLYAVNCESPEGRAYEEALRRIEEAWGVVEFQALGTHRV